MKQLTVVKIAGECRLVERFTPFTLIDHPNLISHVELFIRTALTHDPTASSQPDRQGSVVDSGHLVGRIDDQLDVGREVVGHRHIRLNADKTHDWPVPPLEAVEVQPRFAPTFSARRAPSGTRSSSSVRSSQRIRWKTSDGTLTVAGGVSPLGCGTLAGHLVRQGTKRRQEMVDVRGRNPNHNLPHASLDRATYAPFLPLHLENPLV
jgi:hypothetical protein